jgi:hypothetical protein
MYKYRVTLESYCGECKRITVVASDPYTAMAMAQRGGWYPVDVKQI